MERLKRLGYVLFGAGVALLAEKIINYGASLTYPPILDHGLYGLIIIAISFIILAKRNGRGAGARPSQCKRPTGAPHQPSRGDAQ